MLIRWLSIPEARYFASKESDSANTGIHSCQIQIGHLL